MVLIILTALLMLFSVVLWQLGNETMAGTAGLVAIGLIGDICRRLLGGGDQRPPTMPGPPPSGQVGV